jgi:hypothetical protein
MIRVIQIILLTITAHTLQACPTCTGRVSQESPPFFSDELYEDTSNNTMNQHKGIS